MYPPVNPILLQIGSFELHWYGITMTLAIFLGTLVASRYITRKGGNGSYVWDMLLWILIPAIVGARLYYVFIQSPRDSSTVGFNYYMAHPLTILEVWNGGIHIYGALILGGLALLTYLKLNRLPMWLFLDGVGLGLALGQAIGRIGNFINQELYGPPTTLPWGLRIDQAHRVPPYDNMVLYPDSTRFQPLFLYELIWDSIGFALLLWISRRFARKLYVGDLFLLYLIWVPFGRFLLEFMRTDSWFFPGTPFDTAHILTGGAVLAALVTLIVRHRRKSGTPAFVAVEDTHPAEETAVETEDEEHTQLTPADEVTADQETSTATEQPASTADAITENSAPSPSPAGDQPDEEPAPSRAGEG